MTLCAQCGLVDDVLPRAARRGRWCRLESKRRIQLIPRIGWCGAADGALRPTSGRAGDGKRLCCYPARDVRRVPVLGPRIERRRLDNWLQPHADAFSLGAFGASAAPLGIALAIRRWEGPRKVSKGGDGCGTDVRVAWRRRARALYVLGGSVHRWTARK